MILCFENNVLDCRVLKDSIGIKVRVVGNHPLLPVFCFSILHGLGS